MAPVSDRMCVPAPDNRRADATLRSHFRRRRFQRGFTFTEMMVSVSVLFLVLAGVIGSHLFGVRLFVLTKTKLGASDDARRALNRLIDEVRTAKRIRIGEGDQSSFTEIENGLPQMGSAIQIYPTTNNNVYVRFFLDPTDSSLKRMAHDAAAASTIAIGISNRMVFTAENHLGTVLTNNRNNRVVGLTMQFFQLQHPDVPIGPGEYYESYRLRTRITRRSLE